VGGIAGSDGTFFELSPPTEAGAPWTETVIHRFHGTPDGKISESRLFVTGTGGLVGTTLKGGANDLGTAYLFTPPTGQGKWTERILYSFGSAPDDIVTPNFSLLPSPQGLFAVDQGGANGTGAVYQLTPSAGGKSWTQNILYSFGPRQSGDAALPSGELVRDARGNLYGVTALGGANDLGAIFEVSPPAQQGGDWTETVLFSFSGTDGTLPVGRLLLGAGGVLYGTANGGGASGAGTVFQLAPPTERGGPWVHTVIYNFTGGSDGTSPGTGVISDKKGRLYGTAGGSIFMLRPPQAPGGAWKETTLHSFSVSDGFRIDSPLTMGEHALFGTGPQGGTFSKGIVFQLTIQ